MTCYRSNEVDGRRMSIQQKELHLKERETELMKAKEEIDKQVTVRLTQLRTLPSQLESRIIVVYF